MLGVDVFNKMYAADNILGPLVFFGWTLVGVFLIFNMFFAVLDEALSAVNRSQPQ
jgi:hypothetical protein